MKSLRHMPSKATLHNHGRPAQTIEAATISSNFEVEKGRGTFQSSSGQSHSNADLQQ